MNGKRKRWKKALLSFFIIGMVWSLGRDCMAGAKEDLDRVDQISALEIRIEEELQKGSSSFTTYINKEIETEQLQKINNRLDGFYGQVDRFSQWRFPFITYYKTVFYLDNSDNYYVLAHLLRDEKLPKERQKARELVSAVEKIQAASLSGGMSDYEKIVAVHDFLTESSEYEESSDGESDEKEDKDGYSAYGVLVKHKGVCNGYTQAFQLFMTLNQIDSRIVLGTAAGSPHSWNLVCLENEWYHVDTTWDDPVPDEKNRRIYAYLNVTDRYIGHSHQWDRERYPRAHGTKYNYYVQNDSVIERQKDFTDYARQRLKNEEPMITCLIHNYREKDYKSSLFQKVMEDTKAVSMNLQVFGEGNDKVFLLIPDYGGSSNE